MQVFHHSPEQQARLKELLVQTGQRILNLSFAEPAEDHRRIREHAYLKGKYELLVMLIDDDFPEPEPETQPTE